eukprot:2400600-Prorocentrum_lima.AAC.1
MSCWLISLRGTPQQACTLANKRRTKAQSGHNVERSLTHMSSVSASPRTMRCLIAFRRCSNGGEMVVEVLS